MAEALDQPMNEEEELNIWSAFKQAAPNATTGQDEDALDKDRKTNSSSYKGSTLSKDMESRDNIYQNCHSN